MQGGGRPYDFCKGVEIFFFFCREGGDRGEFLQGVVVK